MLIMSRAAKAGEDTLILQVGTTTIRVVVLSNKTSRVRLGVDAPAEVTIRRGEQLTVTPHMEEAHES